MPAPRGAATFEPIPPDLDLEALVEESPNFQYAPRISCDQIDAQGLPQFERLVQLHVIQHGKPLVVEGFHNRLDQWTFSTQWLRNNQTSEYEQARDLTKKTNLPLSIGHYIDNMSMLTNQWTPANYRMPKQRLYLKDIDCPSLWTEKLRENIPSNLFYLNNSTGDVGGPGAIIERNSNEIGSRTGLGIARAGDLMSMLPEEMQAQNMMCYIGHEGTYTPAHREMCASLGQNIMVESSGTMGEDGKPTKPGSSIWFMTESQDRHLVSEYWLSTLGHDIEVESHFAQIMAWKQAPFNVYIVEQKVGDFILIPPLAPHQVWNRGTRTMKAAWNRTTVETLEMALSEALPRARMVCRDEQYKNKAIVLYTLKEYSKRLEDVQRQREAVRDHETWTGLTQGRKIRQLFKDFKKLFGLFHSILLSENFAPAFPEKKIEYVAFDSNITCSYCRCNIFNRFITCKHCLVTLEDNSEDTYDVCMECYVMGRSCACISKLTWVEQFPWRELIQQHQVWRNQIVRFGGDNTSNIPPPFDEAVESTSKKSLAHICQEQLNIRPFRDPSKGKEQKDEADASDSLSDEVNNDGTLKKKPKKRRSEKWLREHYRCHICCHKHAIWEMALCQCTTGYCYGSLWRAFDAKPQSIMENPFWQCPKCEKVCNCSKCRRDPENTPYEPHGTILGHDTRKFADQRSVEALVDFSSSNTHWLKKAGDDEHPTETRRLMRRIHEAQAAKSDLPMDDAEEEAEQTHPYRNGAVPIDPLLIGDEGDHGVNDSMQADGGEDSMQRAAQDALSALDGLSRLDRDPQAFIAQAGLDESAGMIIETASNGISYEYPDPHALRGSRSIQKDARQAKTGKKRKRADYKQKLENDASVFVDDANRKFYKSQTEKTMAEAKKTGRLISARAALTGESLFLKLRLPSQKLANLCTSPGITQPHEASMGDDLPTPIVQSDLPAIISGSQAITHTPYVPKKRQQGEKDDEFMTGGRDRLKKNKLQQYKSTAPEQDDDKDEHPDSPSDASESALERLISASRRKPKHRSLPAYLARRSPVAEAELPKELIITERRRTQPQTVNRRSLLKQPDLLQDGVSATAGSAARKRPPAAKATPSSAKNAREAELNRRAKLRALEGGLSSDEYDGDTAGSNSDDSLIDRTAPALNGTPKPKDSPARMASTPGFGKKKARPKKDAAPVPKRSIFSKPVRGKIRIMSARNAS